MKELTARQKKTLALKHRIHEEFCKLTKENGDNVTVKDICTAADISVGSFYNLFESKEAVTSMLYESQDEALAKLDYPADPDERIMAVLESVLDISLETGLHYLKMAAVYESKHTPSAFRTSYNEQVFNSTTAKVIIGALEDGQRMGRYKLTEPVWYYSDMLIFMFRSLLLYWQINNGNFDIKPLLERYTQTIITSLHTDNR